MGCSKGSSKWEVYTNTSLPHKTSKKYQIKHQINLNLTLKETRKNNKQTNKQKSPKLEEGKKL